MRVVRGCTGDDDGVREACVDDEGHDAEGHLVMFNARKRHLRRQSLLIHSFCRPFLKPSSSIHVARHRRIGSPADPSGLLHVGVPGTMEWEPALLHRRQTRSSGGSSRLSPNHAINQDNEADRRRPKSCFGAKLTHAVAEVLVRHTAENLRRGTISARC